MVLLPRGIKVRIMTVSIPILVAGGFKYLTAGVIFYFYALIIVGFS
jgi:hypothetical protein